MDELRNYSGPVKSVLEDIDSDIGDRLRIETGSDVTYEGRLMPGGPRGQTKHVILKLDNGYNVGIDVSGDVTIEKTQ